MYLYFFIRIYWVCWEDFRFVAADMISFFFAKAVSPSGPRRLIERERGRRMELAVLISAGLGEGGRVDSRCQWRRSVDCKG